MTQLHIYDSSISPAAVFQQYQYKAVNPDVDDVENVRHDIELLIEEKLKLHPNEKRAIAKAEFVEEAGKERIIVASIGKGIKNL